MKVVSRSRVLSAGAALCLAYSPFTAAGGESEILDAFASGKLKSQTEVGELPGEQARPAPGWEKEPAHFLYELTRAEEKNITDKAFPLMIAKWPFNLVAVCWENPSVATAREQNWVRDSVARTWENHSALQFTGWQTCMPNNKGIRIRIAEDGPHTKGLGKFLNGKPDGMVLNFTFLTWSESCARSEANRKECIESIAVHEFGHAIGFAHEQNRPDTPGECADLKQGTSGDRTDITPWDPNSVMNYCNPVYNNNGVLSEFDIKGVQYVYGPPAA